MLHHYHTGVFCFWLPKLTLYSPSQKSVWSLVVTKVSILDWPHRFPGCETAQIWQYPGRHYNADLSSLCLLKRICGEVEERKRIISRGNFWSEGRTIFLMYLETVTLMHFSHCWQTLAFCFWTTLGQLGHRAGNCTCSSVYQMPSNSCYHYFTSLRQSMSPHTTKPLLGISACLCCAMHVFFFQSNTAANILIIPWGPSAPQPLKCFITSSALLQSLHPR